MNVHVSYKISKTPDLEKLIKQQEEKLGRFLQVFRPDLVNLKGAVEEASGHQGFRVSLNLRLPSGQMAAEEKAATATVAIKAAFDDIAEQLKKHKDLLRNQHKRARRKSPRGIAAGAVPFEDTIAVVRPEEVSAGDISSYINVNLPRLRRFIERELEYRESEEQLRPGQIAVGDVEGEAIADALGESHERPERIKLEPWLYRLSREAIDRLAKEGADGGDVPLERSHGQPNVSGSDEAVLQFHQPDEAMLEQNMIPDPKGNNPEELAAQHEMIGLVETALQGTGRNEREAFILFAIEGFTLDEISHITNQGEEEVRASIGRAREHLQRALPVRDPLKEQLLEYSQSA